MTSISEIRSALKEKRTRDAEVAQFHDTYFGKDSELIHIYTDKARNRYFEVKNLMQLPYLRTVSVEIAAKAAEMCTSRKNLIEVFKIIEKHFNTAQYAKGIAEFVKLLERTDKAGEEETLKTLALNYVLIEGEDPKIRSDYWDKKKIDLWEKDTEAYGFFLTVALKLIRDIEDISGEDTLNYLRHQAVNIVLSNQQPTTPVKS